MSIERMEQMEMAADEIDRLRAQTAELTKERDEFEQQFLDEQEKWMSAEAELHDVTKERDALKSAIQWHVEYANDADRSVTEWMGKANAARKETAQEIITILDNRSWFDGPSACLCAIADIKTKYGIKED